MLYSHHQLHILIWMHKHKDTITTSGHSSLENIPLTLFVMVGKGYERLCVRGELETEQRLQHIECVFFVPLGYLTRGLRAQPLCWELVPTARSGTLTSSSELQLPEFLSQPVISLFYVRSIQPVDSQGYLLISSTGCTCYLHQCISHLTAWTDRRSICNTIWWYYLPTPPLGQDMTQGQFLSGV